MYQIGEFSRICQVSVKTLRHYDRIGLLKPTEVDRFTGYRYYDRTQLERLLLIRKLQRYGFSLVRIQSLLHADSAAFCRELQAQREVLRSRQMELGLILHELTLHLDNLERTGDNMELTNQYRVDCREAPAMSILSCRERMGVDDFGRYYGTLYERVAREHLTPTGLCGAMYHDEEFHRDASDVELFLGIQEREKVDRVIPPRLCAMTVHRGTYSTLTEGYAAMVSWIEDNGYEWTDAPYDIYTKTAHEGYPPEDWETEIWFPVRKRASAET